VGVSLEGKNNKFNAAGSSANASILTQQGVSGQAAMRRCELGGEKWCNSNGNNFNGGNNNGGFAGQPSFVGGRSGGRGGGNGGRGNGGHGSGPGVLRPPPSFMPPSSQGGNYGGHMDGSFHAAAVSINMSGASPAEGSISPADPAVDAVDSEMLLAATRANKANRRPNLAEALVPPPPVQPPVPVTTEDVLQERRKRAVGMAMPTPVSRLANAPVTMRLLDLVEIDANMGWKEAAQPALLNLFCGKDTESPLAVALAQAFSDLGSAGDGGGEKDVAPSLSEQLARAQSVIKGPVGMDKAAQKQQPAGGNAFSTGLGSPVPPTHTSYAMAAASQNLNGRNVLLQSATMMPFVSGHLLRRGSMSAGWRLTLARRSVLSARVRCGMTCVCSCRRKAHTCGSWRSRSASSCLTGRCPAPRRWSRTPRS